ncbi:hypothetical protein U8V72_27410 [Priestia filamentosa]|uniref:hypothetical protein n=1 Tax=Priestia filamentosa TaxID=1402861 RepID=UPI003979B83C
MKNILGDILNDEFESKFKGYFIHNVAKFEGYRKIPLQEIEYIMLEDPEYIVRGGTRNAPPKNGGISRGKPYDVFGTDSFGKPMLIVGRLFDDGNFMIFHGRHENKMDIKDKLFYNKAKEAFYDGQK